LERRTGTLARATGRSTIWAGAMDKPEPIRPPLTTTTSIKPAATVLIVAVVMLFTFVLINAVFDQGTTTPTTVIVVGGLPVAANNQTLAACQLPGIPPSDISSGLIVPIGSLPAGPVDHHSSDAGSFDCSRSVTAPYAQSKILGFYLDQLRAIGWTNFSKGVAANGGGEQFLFQKAGSDTFNWIEGVTVNASASRRTTWTVRLYQDNSLT